MQPLFDASIATTNYAPSEDERATIKEFVQSRRKDLNKLEGKAFNLSLQLASIRKAQTDVVEQIEKIEKEIEIHQALLSPARSLPDDIYREIFLWCLSQLPEPRRPDPLSAPLLITRVCKRWREIAHATPRLWTNLSFCYLDPDRKPLRTDITEKWMKRSGALPISVACEPGSEAILQPAHIGLFATLSPSFNRWSNLIIALKGRELVINSVLHYLDSCGFPNPFHRVDSLELALLIYLDTTAQEQDPHFISSGPRREAYASVLKALALQRNTRLRKLTLCIDDDLFYRADGDLPEAPLSSWLPRSTLEYLSLRDRQNAGAKLQGTCRIPSSIAYQLLRDLPNLVTLKADLGEYTPMDYPPDKFVLKKLMLLSLSFFDLGQLADLDFLPYFEFPSLTFLTIRSRRQLGSDVVYDGATFDALPGLFGPLGRTLTKLILDPGLITAEALIRNFAMLPSLVHLHLKQSLLDADFDKMDVAPVAKWKDNVLECLTPKADSTTPAHSCPNLQYLKWENNTWFSDRALADLILKRSSSPQSPVPLKQVYIKFGRSIQEQIIPECAELLRQGLDLRLTYRTEWEPETSNVFLLRQGNGFTWCLKPRTDVEEEDDDDDALSFGWP